MDDANSGQGKNREGVEVIKLIFPYPDSRLKINGQKGRGHWAVKAKATREVRLECYYMCFEQLYNVAKSLDAVSMTITWYPKTKQFMDWESLLRCTKPMLDAMVDAGVMVDDSPKVIKLMNLRMGYVDKLNPRTEIEVERMLK